MLRRIILHTRSQCLLLGFFMSLSLSLSFFLCGTSHKLWSQQQNRWIGSSEKRWVPWVLRKPTNTRIVIVATAHNSFQRQQLKNAMAAAANSILFFAHVRSLSIENIYIFNEFVLILIQHNLVMGSKGRKQHKNRTRLTQSVWNKMNFIPNFDLRRRWVSSTNCLREYKSCLSY